MTRQWRSLEALQDSPDYRETHRPEFPPNIETVEMDGVSRRKFLGIMGASMTLAGTGAACIRKPVEFILPFNERPEFMVPGEPLFYRTAALTGQGVLGFHVETHEGRPTKIEGNPEHPMNNPNGVFKAGHDHKYGATNAWAQASVLDLYDSARSHHPMHGAEEASWDAFWAFVSEHFANGSASGNTAVLIESTPSPTVARVLRTLARDLNATIYRHDAVSTDSRDTGAATVGAGGHTVTYHLDKAERIVALDADFLGTQGDVVRNSALFAAGRKVHHPGDEISRLYVVEPTLTVTGAIADNRLRLRASQVPSFAAALAGAVAGLVPGNVDASLRGRLDATIDDDKAATWIEAIAADLAEEGHRGKSVIVVGDRQPDWVHGIGHLLNTLLGNVGQTVEYYEDDTAIDAQPLSALVETIGSIDTLVIVGANPVLTAPVDYDFGALMGQVATTVHLGTIHDETGRLSTWHAPTSHFLESWGDWRSSDGTVAIQQPLIAPLYDTHSSLEILARIVRARSAYRFTEAFQATVDGGDLGYGLVRTHWSNAVGIADFDNRWRRWLHDGVLDVDADAQRPSFQWGPLASLIPVDLTLASASGYEVAFAPDYSVYDGRYVTNGWLQEAPDPISKLCWDNAAVIGTQTAATLGVEKGQMVQVTVDGRSLSLPAWIVPSAAEGAIALHLGYGREGLGVVSEGSGSNVYALRASTGMGFADASVSAQGEVTLMANTQDHNSMVPREGYPARPLIRETTPEHYEEDPHFVHHYEVLHEEDLFDLFTPSTVTTGQQWGMTIDLNSCTGCNTCLVACVAENNIPVVGRERVIDGREMHWIRIDRYYTGDDPDVAQAVVQPLPCMQCEKAPCETVCPVGATVHTPDGLNDMSYNRCIGTRYCSNNCPYKVRRFNYFNFVRENDETHRDQRLGHNPNVTMRFRGVMEKCTYCVQRINAAKIDAHRRGEDRVEDGLIITACQQACPTGAIVFGDINDEHSIVAEMKALHHDYVLLQELNDKPRTSYLAKFRNPNPNLASVA